MKFWINNNYSPAHDLLVADGYLCRHAESLEKDYLKADL